MAIPKIIGLCGVIGSGKDTVAQMLIKEYGYKQVSFAEPLKDILAPLFGWDRKLLEGDTKESRAWRNVPDEYWSKVLGRTFTPRDALQQIGTDLFRDHFHKDIWINSIKKRVEDKYPNDRIIFSDCRFLNEINLIKELNGVVLEIQPKVLPLYYSAAKRYKELSDTSGISNDIHFVECYPNIHESEWKWIGNNETSSVIINNGTLDELNEKIKVLFQ